MPDYGHPLEFGVFLTPSNASPQAPVRLAVLAEELGYDLVTFQDHPYQPSFHDTWTLLSWVAAQTQRIRVSANVLNLPLRLPAVTARAAASLDLLSNGRLDLALGAGAFWDGIEAMGGQRLTPGQGVQALDEAIDIIRGIWATDDRSVLRVPGTFHRVDGAKRGPRPAHRIPITLGAYKPRMLRLVGRKADGWLPSLAYLKPGDLTAGNATIDESAESNGRNAGEIRRLLNVGGSFSPGRGGQLSGPPASWVEDLLPLVLEDGISTFIVTTDDPTAMRIFREVVAPDLAERVSRERISKGTQEGSPRSSVALKRRREGIDYDAIPRGLAPKAVEPGDFDYAHLRSTFLRGGSPGLVLRVEDTSQVQQALAFARTQDVSLSLRSGGHGISGRSTNDGGIVIDLAAMNEIEIVDEEKRRVRVGPGARWSEVATKLGERGWALSSGDYGGVGVGGLATAGGIGWLVREHGLTIDHLRSVEMVVADGDLVRASETENPDLFWAVRGAGANFGIVTSFEFEVDVVGQVGWAQLTLDASNTSAFLQRWGAIIETSPRDTTSFMSLGNVHTGRRVAQVNALVDSGDPDTIVERLQPFAEIGPLMGQSVQITEYASVMASADGPHGGQGEPHSRSALVEHLTPEFSDAVAEFLASGAVYFFQIRSIGGAVGDIEAGATAFSNRDANFSIVALGADDRRLSVAWDGLRPHFTGMYLSFESDVSPDRLNDAFSASTLQRLRGLKHRWDPDNVFRDNFNISAALDAADR